MINSVTLVGRMVKSAEIKHTQQGTAVASFTIAVNRPFKAKNGEQEADFIGVTIWRQGAEFIANYGDKGSLVGVTGRISTRNYENNEGRRIYVTEVTADTVKLLESKNIGDSGSQSQQQNGQQSRGQGGQQQQKPNYQDVYKDPFEGGGEPIDVSSDDLPF